MAGLPTPTATAGIWPRDVGTPSGPTPLGGGGSGLRLPTVNNSNLPMNIGGPPPIPQQPRTPFPSFGQPLGTNNSLVSNNYASPTLYPGASNFAPNPAQNAQYEAYQRRLNQLEDENALRRNATSNMTQMGQQILSGQMDVQQQILEYQLMLEQCMETLDHQNFVLNEQAEDLALLRGKMRHLEFFMDTLKHSKEGGHLMRSLSGESAVNDNHPVFCHDPSVLPAPSTSRFFAGGPTRSTASTFQPFNPRYRSPQSRATAAANLNQRRPTSPSTPNRNLPNANNRPVRRLGNFN